ncbi:mitoferrin-1 [Onthophagus taurus]|uniref:mitoferrin-1 n=1 Tax=Onthophagus taurus TaxID=166361 RepID=UPI000C20874D|nr:mitoferrin-1 [Onthophagus taurus]
MNIDDYESLPTGNVFTHMTAGAIAGVMEHCIMYPLDSVKTRMQSLAPTNVRLGVSDTLLRMVKHEGLLRPVRGIHVMVVGAGPSHALYFSSYEYCKERLTHMTTNKNHHMFIHGISGTVATLLHDAIMTPAEVVKQRLQMLHSPYKSVLTAISRIYSTEGFPAFYRSYTTQLTMNIPFQSIHFMVYEFMQKRTNKEGIYNPKAHMVSGAAAGAVAAAVTTPLDVCKTLLNTQQVGATNGLVQAMKTVYRLGGPLAYFRGLQARVMFQVPSTAICWSTYEFFKYILGVTKMEKVEILEKLEKSSGNEILVGGPKCEKEAEKVSIKARELPAMAPSAHYGSLRFNTMHTQDSNYNRRKETILDITHT